MTETSLQVQYYDWARGMKVDDPFGGKKTIKIIQNDQVVTLHNVKFYDTTRGFIQTETVFYMPKDLKEKNANQDQD